MTRKNTRNLFDASTFFLEQSKVKTPSSGTPLGLQNVSATSTDDHITRKIYNQGARKLSVTTSSPYYLGQCKSKRGFIVNVQVSVLWRPHYGEG